ncbi:MAG: thymidine phosphorylase [Fimbriimonas ginsengisoli]|uniref:Thymidine phosphorylase n=1 Tax=Fimbriimonas ginsengisoli TaxID=1005039 RepID=A0A931LUI8_FIMGI|nr:thymidine phosphorylase [Fimbriimonas ginsengisoli]
MLDLIATRRAGGKHSADDLAWLALGAARGEIPDYQLAAWLMAECLRPLDLDETAWLTQGMAASGRRLDRTGLPHPWLDKHSTGGVGDKTTLVVLPILAACGLTVVKMSGRGLGITGGTIDKLESVPGFRVNLTPEEMLAQAARVGIAEAAQSEELAPADKALYALRDATGTVDSIPLIVSSILSKKIASGAEVVVLDVKCGSGAFMKSEASALELARRLVETARRCGLKAGALVTDMRQPLGRTVGNALEVREAISALKSPDEGRFCRLCVLLAAHALLMGEVAATQEEAEARAREALAGGGALAKAKAWFEAQGADAAVFERDDALPTAPIRRTLTHEGAPAFVEALDAGIIGEAAVELGAGRASKDDAIDPAVGFEFHAEIGRRLVSGDPVATVHAASEADAGQALGVVRQALSLGNRPVTESPLVLTTL